MKVLLVQAYLGREEMGGPVFPLGLSYIASALKEHDVKVLDLNAEKDPYGQLKKEISEFDPDVAGISLRNIDTTVRRDPFYYFKELKPTVELIRRTKPSVKLVIGGSGFSMFAAKIMERIPELDVGVYLEGEESMAELMESLDHPEDVKGLFVRKDGEVLFTGERDFPDFNDLPFPDRSIVDLSAYLGPYNNIGIQAKRGCLSKCAYCCYPFLNGNCLRIRSPKNVVDEIEHLMEKFNVNNFMFVDGVFNLPLKHAREICQEIIDRGLDVRWNAWYDARHLDDDFLLLARKAGCVNFSFSPDAITEKGLASLRKEFSVKEINKTLSIVRKMKGVNIGYGLFCNSPGQDLAGYIKTIYFFIKANLLLTGKGGVHLNWIRIEPNTEIHRIALERGIIDKDTELLPHDERELSSLFYTQSSLKYMNMIVNAFLTVTDKLLKPLSKVLRSAR